MADKAAEAPANQEAPPSGGGLAAKLPLILVILNTLFGAGVLGFAYYTKVIFKRPKIVEATEREALEKQKLKALEEAQPFLYPVKNFTINIMPEPGVGPKASGLDPKVAGTLRFVSMGMSFNVVARSKEPRLNEIRPVAMDKIVSMIGRRRMEDLNNVQGRYILKNQIRDLINTTAKELLVSEVYLTDFVVQ